MLGVKGSREDALGLPADPFDPPHRIGRDPYPHRELSGSLKLVDLCLAQTR